jgi:hypothetical protein
MQKINKASFEERRVGSSLMCFAFELTNKKWAKFWSRFLKERECFWIFCKNGSIFTQILLIYCFGFCKLYLTNGLLCFCVTNAWSALIYLYLVNVEGFPPLFSGYFH